MSDYQAKPGDFGLTIGDKGVGFKITTNDGDIEARTFTKKFNWGTVVNGNANTLKAARDIYLRFVKFTVGAVAYYWRMEQEKREKEAHSRQATGNTAASNNQSHNVEDTGI